MSPVLVKPALALGLNLLEFRALLKLDRSGDGGCDALKRILGIRTLLEAAVAAAPPT